VLDGLAASRGLRVLRLFARASPGLFVGAVAFVLAEMVLPSLTLITMGRVVGRIPGAVRDGLGSSAGHQLVTALVIAGCCFGLSMLRGPAQDALSAAAGARMLVAMQGRLITAVSTPVGIAHLEDPSVLDRLSNASGDLTSDQPANAPMTLLGQIGSQLSGILACLVLSTFHWWIGLLLLASWLTVRQTMRGLIRSRVTAYRVAAEPLRRSWYLLGVAWRPRDAKEVRLYGLADWIVDRFRREWLAGMTPKWDQVLRLTRRAMLLSLVVLAVFGLTAGMLGWDAYHRTIGLGMLATMLPMLSATLPAGSVTLTDFSLEMMLAAVPDLDSLTAELAPPEAATATETVGALPAVGLPRREIRFDNVHFRYPSGDTEVLAGLDLDLRAGESLAIVGVNGAGKTTLVTLLARLREPTVGRVLVDGEPLTSLNAAAWQRQVAVVYQDFTRYPLTARENVTLGLLGEPPDEAALERAVTRAGAEGVIAELPHGWDTVLSPHYPKGVGLSGGQWQRLALARALYAVERGARVLVLDEPTSQLDVRAEAAFYDRFLDLTAGTTSVVISHRFSTVRRAHRIAVLEAGRVSELGDHATLLAAGGTYASMFEAQADRFRDAVPAPSRSREAGDRA
jgi:ATP-binding cassette subfamily B protein